MRVWVLVVVAGACYAPPKDACGIACTTTCPDGYSCSAGACLPSDGTTCTQPAIDFATITVGGRHVCGLDTGGAAYCWGADDDGQVGIGVAPTAIAAPSRVGTGTWSALSAGGTHTCGIQAGQVLCWGHNADGQVEGGAGSTYLFPTAVAVTAQPPAFDTISAGGRHTCGLASGQLWCWGFANAIGVNASFATRIGSLTDWTEVSSGADHTCGISASLGLACWGTNDRHQAIPSNGSNLIGAPTPVALPMGRIPIHVFAGAQTTCVTASPTAGATAGELWCWGRNDQGVPNTANGDVTAPTRVGSDATWTAARSNETRACGVRAGQVVCWGTADSGALGDGIWYHYRLPLAMATPIGSGDTVDLTMSVPDGNRSQLACSIAGHSVSCWGEDHDGALGQGIPSRFPTPVQIAAPAAGVTWKTVTAGRNHVCATTSDGALWCWGRDDVGQISAAVGRGSSQPCIPRQPCDLSRPTRAPLQIGVPDQVVAGNDYTCTREAATVHCWGNSADGLLGVNGPSGHSVTTVAGVWTALYGGDRASCAFDGVSLQCWGNVVGVGHNTPTTISTNEISNVRDIRFGDAFACLDRTEDARVCWGQNDAGQLGDGTTTNNPTPTAQETSSVTALAAEFAHGCELAAGTVKCWGSDYVGEAGIANAPNNHVPIPVVVSDAAGALAGCTAVAVSQNQSCAICNNVPECWGSNDLGQLGRGVETGNDSQAAPVALPPGHTWSALALGSDHGCVLDGMGELWCWGDSGRGEVGAGGQDRNLPTVVAPH